MSRQINIYVLLASLLWLLASGGDVYAATCTSNVATGNWNAAGTWINCGATFPGAADDVIIGNGDTVTVTANAAAASISIPTGNQNSRITISGTNLLSVSGAVTITCNSTGDTKQIDVGAGALSAGSIALNAGGATRISQVLLSTGTINVSGNILFTGSTASAQRLVYNGNGTVNIAGTLGTGGTFTTFTGSVTNFNAAGPQTVPNYTYNNLTLSNSGSKTMTGVTTIGGDLNISGSATMTNNAAFTVGGALNYTSTGSTTLKSGTSIFIDSFNQTAGTFIDNGNTITVTGTDAVANTWSQTGGSFTASGTVVFTGAAPRIGASSSNPFYNLTINVGDGNTAILTSNATLSNNLTMTTGRIVTGSFYLDKTSICTSGITTTATRYVVGNLSLHYPTNAGTTTCTFPIGDASNYTPAIVAMTGVTSSLANSILTAHTDTSDHADTTAGTSGIDKDYSVNRTWTLTPGGSLAFTSHSDTFTFVAGDIDSGATPANFIVGRKNGGTWSNPTVGTKTATTTQATGMAAFGEFAIGETTISGTVFEDINYSGGAGRNMTTSGGAAIANVLVEMYSNAGALLSSTTTNASGVYKFPRPSGTYTVRVVNSSISSTRGCAAGTCLPVQTYRTNASTGTAIAVTDHVGGENPAVADAGNSTLTGAQSITTVVKGAANVTGIDFGFNFDTIVSVRDAGQGSLRQFILNANALTGADTSIFMVPNHLANPGQNTGYANQLTTSGANSGAAVITLASVLPPITGDNTTLDGTIQTAKVGDTNPGTVGTGGTVGTMAQTLPRFNRPEVVISAAATQLTGSGASVVIKGLAIANGGITINGSNSQVVDCLSGMNADGTYNGSVTPPSYGITAGTGTGILISHNYVKINNSGIRSDSAGANLTIQYNEVDAPLGTPGGGHTGTFDGILIVGTASNVTIQYNLSKNQRGGGLEYGFNGGTVISGTAQGNTILNNGSSGGARSAEPVGVAIWQLSAGSNLTITQNVITGNAGPGIIVISASGVIITQNSIYANGTLATDTGIDLNSLSGDPNTYTAQGVTLNDLNDPDTGPNGLLNFPVIESATISGSNLILKGWARPGSVIEFFLAATDASGFGSGKTYLTTLTEGSGAGPGADTDTTSSTYAGAINGVAQGTDNTNRFQFTIALPGGVALGTVLTATATLGGNTSEFSGNVTVSGLPLLTVTKTTNPVITSINPGQPVTYTSVITNSGTGTATNVELTDTLSPYTAWGVNSFAGIAFQFVDGPVYGGAASGVTLGTPVYSNDKGVSWSYSPSSTGGGAPAGYDANVTNWKIPMTGTMNGWPGGGNPKPGFTINYKVLAR